MRRLALVAAMAVVLAACNGDSQDTTTTAAEAQETTTTPASSPDTTDTPTASGLSVADTSLGTVLVDDSGRTVYIFTVDVGGESACYDDCEANWPVVPASLGASDGLSVELGSHTRTDGNEQLTVNGRPVYLFAGDSSPGDVNGQGVGDVWFAVGADGEPLMP